MSKGDYHSFCSGLCFFAYPQPDKGKVGFLRPAIATVLERKRIATLRTVREAMIQTTQRQFVASDGVPLSYAVWHPVGDYRRTIAVLHGIGFNGEPYSSIIDDLPLQGTGLAALDLRGHGSSGGKRGSLPHHDRILADVFEWLDLLRQEYSGLPLYLLGESMGAIYGTLFAKAHGDTISGLILAAPPMFPSMTQIVHFDTARTILSMVIPFVRHQIVLTGWRLTVGSADQEFIEYRRTSPKALSSVSIGYLVRLGRAIAGIGLMGRVQIDCPVFLTFGTDDKVVSPLGCRWLFARIANSDKTLLAIQGARHTVLWDPFSAKLFSGLSPWIQDHEQGT